MRTLVNEPIAKTFGWLHVNGTEVDIEGSKDPVSLVLAENEERILILGPDADFSAEIPENAVLKLIQLERGGGNTSVGKIHVRCGRQARFEWYYVALSGTSAFSECVVKLEGEKSTFLGEIGYRLEGDDRLDVNCEVIHTGKKTESDIQASGVLSSHARKLLRGTIDLRTGCSGSVGNEMEDILLLDETVQNLSVPVILCSEEDVVGNHGATIGQLDENLMFYLESRGIARDAVYEIMAKAKLDAVISKLPDETLREQLLKETDL